jgi:hypothetical protein
MPRRAVPGCCVAAFGLLGHSPQQRRAEARGEHLSFRGTRSDLALSPRQSGPYITATSPQPPNF